MKIVKLILIFTFITPFFLLGQGKVAKVTNERWNADENRWQFIQEETWDYDQNQTGKEILFTHRDSLISFYTPQNYRNVESIYDNQGNLVEQKIKTWGDTENQEIQINSIYNHQNQLIERLTKNTRSTTDDIYFTKEVYERDESENRRSYTNFQAVNTTDHFIADHRRDSFFNANGCLLKQTILNYDEVGTLINERWWTSTFAEEGDCQELTSGQWGRYETGSDSMILYSRNTFEYSNDNRTVANTYERYKKTTDLWNTEYLIINEYDEEERIVRYFWEQYKWNYTDTLLKIYTYTPFGEINTYQEFKTAYAHNDEPLRLIHFDRFEYIFNDEDKLISKKQFRQDYSNPIREIISEYEYYCNGQLKREITSEIGQYEHRETSEYHGNADCELADTLIPEIKIYPNPTNGIISVSSNLLTTENATVQVYNMIGQEVYHKKINRVSERLVLQLSNLASGQYIFTIRNDKEVVSEAFLIY